MLQKFRIIVSREVGSVMSATTFFACQRRTCYQQRDRVQVLCFVSAPSLRMSYPRTEFFQLLDGLL